MKTLQGRSFTKETDLSAAEFHYLLKLAIDLKKQTKSGSELQRLVGKSVALIFEKTSTRTRAAFEVAMTQQGGSSTVFDSTSAQLGHKESIADTAKVLSRMYDAIMFRGALQETVEELAANSTVPVINGLTDQFHPTQMLADLLTMQESAKKPLADLKFCYLGDARNNMGNSFLITSAILGLTFTIGAPKSLWPDDALIAQANQIAEKTGAKLNLTQSPTDAVKDAEFVHTDVWVSMGEPKSVWKERIDKLLPYQVNKELMNSAAKDAKFMHCLPAFHDEKTEVGLAAAQLAGISGGLEVTDDVFQSNANIAFDQAENRLHTTKAILIATILGE
ncbi:MAG: ornithine carbamoyltransferase [Actinobacteria bacterium]|nr:ornithine carbamoyltransferase [Actinomycetota bacterium]